MKLDLNDLTVESFPTAVPQAETTGFAPTPPYRTCWPCEPNI